MEKKISYFICSLITFLAILGICGFFQAQQTGYLKVDSRTLAVIALGFPFFFNLRNTEFRNMGITLCILVLFLRQGWIGITCLAITCSVIYWKKFGLVIALGILILFAFLSYRSPVSEIKERGKFYSMALEDIRLFGHGINAFANRKIMIEDKWLHTAHNDLFQFIYDYGYIPAILLVFLFLIPLKYLVLDNVYLKTVFASYLCLLFQTQVDFPFYRIIKPGTDNMITPIFGLLIMVLIYEITIRRKKCVLS